jgi:hypothetical protein
MSPFQSLRPKAAMLMKPEALRRVLGDPRSGQVVFVSHCMLNQNVATGVARRVPERSTRWWPGCNAPEWASSRCLARSSAPGVAWRSGTPCLFTAPSTRSFAGYAARPLGCSCSTRVWPTAVSRARSPGTFVTTSGPADPYRWSLASAVRPPVGCAPRWISMYPAPCQLHPRPRSPTADRRFAVG